MNFHSRRIKSDTIHFLKPETRKTRIKFCLHNLYISLENVLTPLQFEKGRTNIRMRLDEIFLNYETGV